VVDAAALVRDVGVGGAPDPRRVDRWRQAAPTKAPRRMTPETKRPIRSSSPRSSENGGAAVDAVGAAVEAAQTVRRTAETAS
jgi:hypothetical protein